MLIKKQINLNVLKIIFFGSIYLLGLNIFKDYGIYLDDEYQRENSFFWPSSTLRIPVAASHACSEDLPVAVSHICK